MSPAAAVCFVGYCLAAYLLGSVPFGYVLGRLKGVDIRRQGSRNIGATNCWRVCGWRFGLPAFLLDVGKGLASTLVAAAVLLRLPAFDGLGGPAHHGLVILAGVSAIAGHVFPVYLGFRGGKAVATSLGVFLGMPAALPFAAAAFAIWALVFLATRYVSVASTVAALAMLGMVLALEPWRFRVDLAGPWKERWPLAVFTIVLVALVLVRHRANYRRLLAGTESRFGRTAAADRPKE